MVGRPFGWMRSRRTATVLVGVTTTALLALVPISAVAADGSGNVNVHLGKTVAAAALTPNLRLALAVDQTSAIPGTTLSYTAAVSNTGATFTVSGQISAGNSGSGDATVATWSDVVSTSQVPASATNTNHGHDTSQWAPLAGAQGVAPGYTVVSPPTTSEGLTLTVTPVAAAGVTYPAGGDRILGTDIGANDTATWNYVATMSLDPAQASQAVAAARIRNELHLEVLPRNSQAAQPATVDTEFTNLFLANHPSAAVTNVSVSLSLPGATTASFSPSTNPSLSSIPPGGSVTLHAQATVPVPAPRSASGSDADYLSMLQALEGAALVGSGTATGTGGTGSLSAKAPDVTTTEHVPVVSIGKTGPATALAGTTATYPLTLANGGGATASSLAVIDVVPGDAGTVSGVPASLAPGATAAPSASYAIPLTQTAGPLTDVASVIWQDANGDAYGPVGASFTTTVRSPASNDKLTLSPTEAGPDVTGSSQALVATLLDGNGQPVAAQPVTLTVIGPNATILQAVTDASGKAGFTYVGSAPGTDTAQATTSVGGSTVSSDTATIAWVTPVQPVSITTVQGNFYAESSAVATFVAKPGDTPAFGQAFPNIAFNPPPGVIPHNQTGVSNSTTPFTDVTTDVDGNGNGTIVAQGNGYQAGTGALSSFDAVFTGDVVVAAPGDVTFAVYSGSGFLLGFGGGATRVNGSFEGNPPATTPFQGYQTVGAWDQLGPSTPAHTVTVHFPAAGSFPFELDGFVGQNTHDQSLVLTTQTFVAQTSPISVYVGYADGLRPAGSIFPFPWRGSPNVTFVGCQGGCTFDGGAIRVDNSGPTAVTVNSFTVDFGSCDFAIWPGNQTLPAGGIMIFAQTASGASSGCDNHSGLFDTSDLPFAGFCGQNGLIPHVNITIDGSTTTYVDTGQVLDTLGRDTASCPGINESESWTRVGGGGTPVNTPLPPAASLDLTPNASTGTVGVSRSFTVTAMDAGGAPVPDLPVIVQGFGDVPFTVNATTDSEGVAQVPYLAGSPGNDTVQATAFVTGMRTLSNVATASWTEPAGSVPPPTSSSSSTAPPTISGMTPPNGTVVSAATPVTAAISAAAGDSIATWAVSYAASGGSPVTIGSGTGAPPAPPAALATFDPSGLAGGTYAITVAVTTAAGASASQTNNVVIGSPTPLPPPSIAPPSPASGSTVTSPQPITASITPPAGQTIASWSVTATPAGGGAPVTLASGTGTPPAVLATFDPTVLDNGIYAVTVSATASGGGIQSTTTDLSVSGNLKLGHYTTTYQDLSVPVNGFNMAVDRTYDSFDTSTGDFGVGWHVDVSNFDVRANGPLGRGGWTQYNTQCFFFLCNTAFSTSVAHFVTVTFPDGHEEQFDFTPTGGDNLFGGGNAAFTARAGTTSTLAPVGDTGLIYDYSGDLLDGNLDPYNPTEFKLTTANGDVLLLDTTHGLLSETDANGNTLTVDASGVHASNGAGITFTRDAGGRITQVTGPDGSSIHYGYSAAGDLTTVSNASGVISTYTYDGAHHLLSADDGAGKPLRTLTYDASGRLATVTDGAGDTVDVSSDPGSRTQTLSDPAGTRTTVETFDASGNLIRTDVLSGGKTLTDTYTYDANGNRTSFTDPTGATTSGTYDAAGHLLSETSPSGETTTFTYDAAGSPTSITSMVNGTPRTTTLTYDAHENLISKIDPTGAKTTYHYDAAGNLTQTVDPTGAVSTDSYNSLGQLASQSVAGQAAVSYTYDADGRLLTSTGPLSGQTRSYAYDAAGRLSSVTDPLGNVTSYSYDASGRLQSVTGPVSGATTSYTYDAAGRVASVTDPDGDVTTYKYDKDGDLIEVDGPVPGTKVSYTYDGWGRRTSMTDADGNVTTYTYDGDGRLTSTLAPGAAQPSTTTYDAAGNVRSSTDPTGATTTYTYDQAGDLLSSSGPLPGQATTYTYDAGGRVTSSTDPLGHAVTTTYDGDGRPLTVAGPMAGETVTYGYEPGGNLASQTDADGYTTTYGYDGAGDVTSILAPGGTTPATFGYDAAGNLTSVTDATGVTLHYTYDAAGHQLSSVDPMGDTTTSTYDPAGRLLSTTDPDGAKISYAYDQAGRQVKVTDALGSTVSLGYDAAGHETSVTDPGGLVTTLGYDPAGLLASESSAARGTTTWSYDGDGRMTGATTPLGSSTYTYDPAGDLVATSGAVGTTSSTYDLAGRRSSLTDSTGTTTYGYDAAGDLTSLSGPEGSLSATFDPSGRQASLTSGGHAFAYAYGADGRLASITDSGNPVASYSWDGAGRLLGVSRGNNVSSNYAYDSAGRLTSISDSDGLAYSRTLDAAGNTVSTTGPSGTTNYTLDADGRLTQVSYPGGHTTTYTYDASGNRTSQTVDGSATNYTYGPSGRLTAVGSSPVTYDAAGDVTGVGTTTYGYNGAGELTSVGSGSSGTTYTYDGNGNRVSSSSGGSTTGYLWDPTGSGQQLVGAGSTTLLHGPDGVTVEDGPAGSAYPLTDPLGDVTALTGSGGGTTATAGYDAFGVPTASGSVGPLGYTGALQDATGLVDLQARTYQPTLGRFLQPDSFLQGGPGTVGYNPYLYAGDNPSTMTDPSGHEDVAEFSLDTELFAILVAVTLAALAIALIDVMVRVNVDVNVCALVACPGAGTGTGTGTGTGEGTGLSLDDLAKAILAATATAVLTKVAATEIARACQDLAGNPLFGADPCGGGKNLFVAGGDYLAATVHDAEAMVLEGKPAMLNRTIPSNSRTWLRTAPACQRPVGSGLDCDEYPYASTRQGGQANAPSLRLIPAFPNQRQGGVLGVFYSTCGIGDAGPFTVIPVPVSGVPTVGLCNVNIP